MALAETIHFHPKTDVGRVRDLNEDNFLVDKKLALTIVADGMGGHAAGEVASAIAVRIIHQEIRKRADLVKSYGQGRASRDASREIQHVMESAVLRACSRVHEEAKADTAKRGMGTTLSSLLVCGTHGFVAHVGDSRIYLYRHGKVQQITEDHTVYNELVKRGRLTKEQIEKVAQKNAVTRAVGVYERVDVDTLMLDLLPGDQFLLASDGLHGYINHVAELEPYFEDEDGERAATELIELANKKGGKDNITCVIVRIGRPDQSYADMARRLEQKRQALRNMPLFSKLQDRELLRIMQVAEVLEFEAGEDVVREGDRGDELFIVVEGMLSILRGEQVLSEVGPGEHFGEMALIRSSPRSATVRATEKSELLVLRRGDFFSILRKEYELAVKLLWQFLGVLADRLDQTSRDLSSAKEELAAEDISDAIAEDEVEDAAAKGELAFAETGRLPVADVPRLGSDEDVATSVRSSARPAARPATSKSIAPKDGEAAASKKARAAVSAPTSVRAPSAPDGASTDIPKSSGISGAWRALKTSKSGEHAAVTPAAIAAATNGDSPQGPISRTPSRSQAPAPASTSAPVASPVDGAPAPVSAKAAASTADGEDPIAKIPIDKTMPSVSPEVQAELRKRVAVPVVASASSPPPSGGSHESGEGRT